MVIKQQLKQKSDKLPLEICLELCSNFACDALITWLPAFGNAIVGVSQMVLPSIWETPKVSLTATKPSAGCLWGSSNHAINFQTRSASTPVSGILLGRPRAIRKFGGSWLPGSEMLNLISAATDGVTDIPIAIMIHHVY